MNEQYVKFTNCHDCGDQFSYCILANSDEYWRIGIKLCPACLQVRRWMAEEAKRTNPSS